MKDAKVETQRERERERERDMRQSTARQICEKKKEKERLCKPSEMSNRKKTNGTIILKSYKKKKNYKVKTKTGEKNKKAK